MPRKQGAKAQDHRGARSRAVRRPYQDVERIKIFLLQTERLSDASLDAVAINRARRMLSRHQHAEAGLSGVAPFNVKNVALDASPRALAQQSLELRFLSQPATGV